MIKVIRDKDALIEIKTIWNRLYELDTTVTPFQKFDYQLSSLALYPNIQLYIVLVKNDPTNEWIAVFPFAMDSNHNLCFINARHTDFCAPLIHPDYNHYNLYKELADFIHSDKSIAGLHLDNLIQSSSLLSVLKPHFKYSITHDNNYYSTIPILKLPSDTDSIDSFRFVQAKHRQKLRKTRKNCLAQGGRLEILKKADDRKYPEDEINSLMKIMIADGIRAKEYFSDQMLSYFKALYEANILTIALLYESDELRSCNFIYYDERCREYIKWIMLYKENSWNMVLNIMLVDYIYNHGGGSINFARGIYDYKLSNFHPDVKPLFCVKISKTGWGHFRNILSTAFHFSKPIIKSFLRK